MTDLASAPAAIAPESLTARRLRTVWRLAVLFSVTHLVYLAASLVDSDSPRRVPARAVATLLALAATGLLTWWGVSALRRRVVDSVVPAYAATALSAGAVAITAMLTFPLSDRATTTGEPLLSAIALYLSVASIWLSRPARLASDSGA